MSRNIFGWDLPPGCSTKDLPGNQDSDAEAFYESMYEQFPEDMDETLKEKLADWAWKMMGEAYKKGYDQGGSDEKVARAYEKYNPSIDEPPY